MTPILICVGIYRKKFFGKFFRYYYFCGMDKLMNKFLDEYIGDGVVVKNSDNRLTLITKKKVYELYSDKGILIFIFVVFPDGEQITIYRGATLCSTIGGYFGISSDDSMRYVREWFGDKYNINKVNDILKFIPVNTTPCL